MGDRLVKLQTPQSMGGDRDAEDRHWNPGPQPKGPASTRLDPAEEVEEGGARSREPAARIWVSPLPAGEDPEVSAGGRAARVTSGPGSIPDAVSFSNVSALAWASVTTSIKGQRRPDCSRGAFRAIHPPIQLSAFIQQK